MVHRRFCIMKQLTCRCALAAVAAAALVVTPELVGHKPAAGMTGNVTRSGIQDLAGQQGSWPQWRGAYRDGRVPEPAPAGGWPEQVSALWVREVGEGYSGPVAADDRVWVHSRRGEQEVVSCLYLSSGGIVWSKAYDAPFRQDDDARGHGRGPYSTPSIADGRLFTFGVGGVLSAWDSATGSLLWRRESGKEFSSAFPYFGEAASPLVWGQLCFVHLGGDDRSKFDSPGTGAMVALRVADGREQWRWAGDGPAVGASPVIGWIGASPQLIFKTKRKIVGVDPSTGRELWQVSFKVTQDNTIVTPLIVGDRLVTSDYEFGIGAWQIRSNSGAWSVLPLWKTREVSLFMNSPVLTGGILVGFSHFRKGQLFLLDPADGRLLWRGAPRSGEHASLVSWGNQVLVFREDGWLEVGDVSRDGIRTVRRYRLGSSNSWGHPAIVEDRILVRDGTRIAAFRLSGRDQPGKKQPK